MSIPSIRGSAFFRALPSCISAGRSLGEGVSLHCVYKMCADDRFPKRDECNI